MIGTRHEEYKLIKDGQPFVLFANLERSALNYSTEMNWHDNLELQLCTGGSGTVLLDGKRYIFLENDVITVNSNVIHYTSTDSRLCYSALIISSDFCKQMGIDYDVLYFSPLIKSSEISDLFKRLQSIYLSSDISYKIAKQNELLLKILVELSENFSTRKKMTFSGNKSFENVKKTVKYIRENFSRRLSLDELSRNVYTDKYSFSREFKSITGQTVVEYINSYRCQRAADCILSGLSVSESAQICGFNNFSYFTKTFKMHMGILPSELNRKNATKL